MADSKDEFGLTGSIVPPNPKTARGNRSFLRASKDGRFLMYGSGTNVVVRSAADPTKSVIYSEHKEEVTACDLHHMNTYMVSGDASGLVRVWAFDHPDKLLKKEVQAFGGAVADISWDGEGKRIIAVSATGTIKGFMWDTGSSIGEFIESTKPLTAVSFKPQRPFACAIASEDFTVQFYKNVPYKYETSLGEHTNFVNSVRYSPDGEKFLSVGSDKKIVVYDGKTGAVVSEVPNAHKGSIMAVAWSSDGKQFATASADKTVKLWDAATLEATVTFNLGSDILDQQLAVVFAGTQLISLSLRGHLLYLDPAHPDAPTRAVSYHQSGIRSLHADPKTGHLVLGLMDGQVAAYATSGAGATVTAAGFVLNGGPQAGGVSEARAVGGAVVASSPGETARFGSITDNKLSTEINVGSSASGATIFNAGGHNVSVIANQSQLRVYVDGEAGKALDVDYVPSAVASTVDGAYVFVGGENGKVYFYRVSGDFGLELAGVSGAHQRTIASLAVSADGKFLAAGDKHKDIRVYDVSSQTCLIHSVWTAHGSTVRCVAWSPDGTLLASGGMDGTVYVWDRVGGEKKTALSRLHGTQVSGIVWDSANSFWSSDIEGILRHSVL